MFLPTPLRICLLFLTSFGLSLPLYAEETSSDSSQTFIHQVLTAGEDIPDARIKTPRHTRDAYHPWMPPQKLDEWLTAREKLKTQIAVSNGLWPMPPQHPLNATIHGKINRGDYTIEKSISNHTPDIMFVAISIDRFITVGVFLASCVRMGTGIKGGFMKRTTRLLNNNLPRGQRNIFPVPITPSRHAWPSLHDWDVSFFTMTWWAMPTVEQSVWGMGAGLKMSIQNFACKTAWDFKRSIRFAVWTFSCHFRKWTPTGSA